MSDDDERDWLLISLHTGGVAALRMYAWRALRRLGAIYLQQSVCLLPNRPAVARAVTRVAGRVREQSGQARVLQVRLTDAAEHTALMEEQRAERDVEYAEVVQRVPQLLAEIEQETARGRATYAEVEESEADLERFQRWLARISERDYFNAPGGQAARDAVQRCVEALAGFEAAALRVDTGDTGTADDPAGVSPSVGPHLRLVKGEEGK
jgi:hypothetical protein